MNISVEFDNGAKMTSTPRAIGVSDHAVRGLVHGVNLNNADYIYAALCLAAEKLTITECAGIC